MAWFLFEGAAGSGCLLIAPGSPLELPLTAISALPDHQYGPPRRRFAARSVLGEKAPAAWRAWRFRLAETAVAPVAAGTIAAGEFVL